MSVVRFTSRPGNKWAINFSYDPKLVEAIKSFPSYQRSWDPATKTWTLDEAGAKQFAIDLRAKGHTVEGYTPTGPGSARQRASTPPPLPPPRQVIVKQNWAEALFERIPPELHTSVYRALSNVLHADKGGDDALQSELNGARRAAKERDNHKAAG